MIELKFVAWDKIKNFGNEIATKKNNNRLSQYICILLLVQNVKLICKLLFRRNFLSRFLFNFKYRENYDKIYEMRFYILI